ncbi:response regulator [Emcibacter sp.]|uniref:response regulator n=1 Tax=Emcibacter sp. TaxID=1979954 RepID=UPI003A934E19
MKHEVTKPILVIEDSKDDFEAILYALKQDGNLKNPIHRCDDGFEALTYLQECTEKDSTRLPCLILLDLNMPGRDGRHILKDIKSDANLNHIPTVILTTSEDQKDIGQCYRNGASVYIQKPSSIFDFIEIIKPLKEYLFELALHPKQGNTKPQKP